MQNYFSQNQVALFCYSGSRPLDINCCNTVANIIFD